MNYIIAGLIGILVWQIIGLIAYEASGENDDVFIYILCVPVFILNIFGWCYKKLRFAWCKKNLNEYIFYWNGDRMFSQVYMTNKQAEKLYHEGENNCYIKKRSKGHDWKSAPYKGDIYKGQEEFHGIDMKKFWR